MKRPVVSMKMPESDLGRSVLDREKQYWSTYSEFDWLDEKSIQHVIDLLPGLSGDVLELCSGSGMFTRRIPGGYRSYTCLDLSQSLLDALKREMPLIEIVQGNAEDPQFPEASFDAILIFAGLHHLPDMGKSIRNAYRLLRREGILFCFEPNNACWYRKPMFILRDWIGIWTEDERFISPDQLKGKLEEEGFRKIKEHYLTPSYNRGRLNPLTRFLTTMMRLASRINSGAHWQSFFVISAAK